jgi:hypothetical protein
VPASITMTLPAAARELGIGETKARQMAKAGEFPGAFKLRGTWLVHRVVFAEQVERLARGLALDQESDQIVERAVRVVSRRRS